MKALVVLLALAVGSLAQADTPKECMLQRDYMEMIQSTRDALENINKEMAATRDAKKVRELAETFTGTLNFLFSTMVEMQECDKLKNQ